MFGEVIQRWRRWCARVSVSHLVKKRAIVAGSRTTGTLQWSYEGCVPHAKISYEANLVDPNAAWLRLTYTASGKSHGLPRPARYHAANLRRLPLVASVPAGTPGRRTASPRGEALPAAGQEVFRKPRGSTGLAYTSCQDSGKFDGLYRRLAAAMGTDPVIYQPRAEKRL